METSFIIIAALTAIIAFAVGAFLFRSKADMQSPQQQALEGELAELKQQLVAVQNHKLVLETQQQGMGEQLAKAESYLQQREQVIADLQQQLRQEAATKASLQTELEQQRVRAAESLKTLEETRQQLNRDFELLANRIFEEKTERFNHHSKTTLDTALTPLREQLKDFKSKVEDVYDKDSKERVTLAAKLDQLKELNQQMSADALNLTNALKGDNKAQGNWGEVILERVLEESGLHKGREYDTQVSFKADQGRSQPDVIIRLPENKDLIIDSKVSLVHYERYCNDPDESNRQQALKDHVASVRAHIKGLSIKNYEGLEGLRTLDFVLIFIPIESAFMAAFEHDQAMFREAYEKNIIVVGPTTLLATLRTIQSIWRYERQNKNAEEIARQAGAMYDKFVGFVGDLDKVADYIQKAGKAQQDAVSKLSSGRGNLVTSAEKLKSLGAKVKKSLPNTMTSGLLGSDEIVENADEDDDAS
ncbi:DNA recombination protein RmuC [Oceanicoccus sp. KOV_DT_Chl]|uniref:DNA recombination protein RmuC n=1 Tax=Oceanicoccus sp. KOV_DT_Chl TaxID=1904639 RepID=UPI001F2B29E4|nr:DNA recombination protein RmuC [Oceanicoccus sp. KOV_DT_Chl]